MQIVITDAGLAAIVDADNNGLTLVITEMRVGSGQWTPDSTATALQSETKTITDISGAETLPGVLRINVIDDSTDSYQVGELGFFDGDGTLIAVYSQTSDWITEKAAGASLVLAMDMTVTQVDPATIEFGSTTFALPAGTTDNAGILELATDTEVDNGDAGKAVDAQRLQDWLTRTKTDDLATDDSSKLGTAAAIYALKQLIDSNTSAISAINTLLTSDNVSMDTLQEIVDVIEAATDTLGSLAIANVAGLQTALDGKSATSHTHTIATDSEHGFLSYQLQPILQTIFGRNNELGCRQVRILVDLNATTTSRSSTALRGYFDGSDNHFKVEVDRTATGTHHIAMWKYNTTLGDWELENALGFSVHVTLAPATSSDEYVPMITDRNTSYQELKIRTENSSLNDCPYYLEVAPLTEVI